MGPPYVVGVDGGTVSIRAGVFDASGRALSFASSDYDTSFPQPGWAEQVSYCEHHRENILYSDCPLLRSLCQGVRGATFRLLCLLGLSSLLESTCPYFGDFFAMSRARRSCTWVNKNCLYSSSHANRRCFYCSRGSVQVAFPSCPDSHAFGIYSFSMHVSKTAASYACSSNFSSPFACSYSVLHCYL